MSHLPAITNAFVMPGVSAGECHSLLVGLVIDERQIAWGECSLETAGAGQEEQINEGSLVLHELIIPALIGQPLANITLLMEQIDGMRREVRVARPVSDDSPPPKRSRRELFTSLLNPGQEMLEVVERPLPPELRCGVSQALFSAAAQANDLPIVEMIARLYSLKAAETPPSIHLVFDDLPNPADPALVQITAGSYGLTVAGEDPVKELGSSGIRFQNRVRQLKNRAIRYSGGRDTGFLFDMKGGFGSLYEQKSGPILGALNGLEQVVKPYRLRLVDPVIQNDRQGQIEIMKELKAFLSFRKMQTGLIGRAWLESAEDVHAFADAGCVDGVLLDMARLGTLHRTFELAGAAGERGLAVILAGMGVGSEPGKAAVHAALALNPALVAVGVGEVAAVSNEMNRALAWQAYRRQ